MAKSKDVFGFDELEKAFKQMEKKWPEHGDAMLMAAGKAVQKRTKENSPKYMGRSRDNIKPGQLQRSWTLKKVKLYQGGKIHVVRIQSAAPHSHLIEDGHRIFTTRRTRNSSGQFRQKNKRSGKVSTKYNAVQRAARGIKKGGTVQGEHMLENAIKEYRSRFEKDADKLMDKLIEEFEKS